MAGITIGVGVTGLEQLQKAVTLLEKTGNAGADIVASFKATQTTLTEFVKQVQATETSFKKMVTAFSAGNAEFSTFTRGLSLLGTTASTTRSEFIRLATVGSSWISVLDGIYSAQLRNIVNAKAEVQAENNLSAALGKAIAIRSQMINLREGETAVITGLIAVEEAELAVEKALAGNMELVAIAAKSLFISQQALTAEQRLAATINAGLAVSYDAVAVATKAMANADLSAVAAKQSSIAVTSLLAKSQEFLAEVTARLIGSYGVLTTEQIALIRVSEANRAVSLGLASAYNAQAAATAKSGSAFTAVGSTIRGVAGATGSLWLAYGQLLPMLAGFAAAASAIKAVKLGSEFEYLTTSIQSLSKDVEGAVMPLENIQKQLLAMRGLRHTPTELAAGMREFAKAGVGPADALRDLATLSKFATIAEMDLGEAIKDVIGLTLAFKPTMEAAGGGLFTFADAANMLAAAAMLSITDVKEMSDAFAHAAELGIVSGMRFEEVAASLAIMANAGIRGSKAATSLRTGMLKLQTAGDPVHKMFKDIGRTFNAFNADGSAKNVIDTFKELNTALAGVTDETRIAIFNKLFTAKSMKSGAVLSQQVEDLDAFIKRLREAAEGVGFIEQKYQDLSHTTKAEWDFLKVEFEKELLKPVDTQGIADALSSVRGIIKDISPFYNNFAKISGALVHDVTNLIALKTKFSSQSTWLPKTGIPFYDTIGLFEDNSTELVDLFSNLNIVQVFRDQFYDLDILFVKLGESGKIAAATLEGTFEYLGSLLKIIFGTAINWVIDKLFTIPEAISNMISMVGQATKDVPLLSSFYSPAMSAIGDTLTNAAKSARDALKIDFSDENAQLKESGDRYATRIASIEASTQAILDQKAAIHEAVLAVEKLNSSYGILAKQQNTLPTLGNPKSGGNPVSSIGYFFGAGLGKGSSAKVTIDEISSEEAELLDRLLPPKKAQKDYNAGREKLNSLRDRKLLDPGEYETALANLSKLSFGSEAAGDSVEDFHKKVTEAFGTAAITGMSDYQQAQEKIKNTFAEMVKSANSQHGTGSPAAESDIAFITGEMEKAQEAAEALEKVALGDFSKQMTEAFGDASAGKLSNYGKAVEKISDLTTGFEAEIKERFKEDDNGVSEMEDKLKGLGKAALQAADEMRKADVAKSLQDISDAFGKQDQRNMSEYDKELARINQLYRDQVEIINKDHPGENAEDIADRATEMGYLNEQYELLIHNSDILIKKGDNLWAGFSLGIKDAIADTTKLGEVGYAAAGLLSDAFHETFTAVLKGDFESIGDLWDKLLNSMLDLFIDWIAKLLAKWALGALGDIIVGSFGGLGGALSGALGALGLGGGSGGGLGTVASLGSTGYQAYSGTGIVGAVATKVMGMLGLGPTPVIPAVGAQGVAPAVAMLPGGAPTTGFGSWFGSWFGGGSTAPATSTAAAPTTGSSMSSLLPSAGAMAVMAVAAVGAMAAFAHFSKMQEPNENDKMNAMGLRPESFAYLIGNAFQKAVLPIFGQKNAKWDVTSSSLVMLKDSAAYKSDRDRSNEMTSPGIDTRKWTGSTWAGSYGRQIEQALRALQTGMSGIPGTVELFSAAVSSLGIAMDPTTVQGIWDWGKATQTTAEKVQEDFTTLGLKGAEMHQAMALLDKSLNSASGSTQALEKYLGDLGYNQEQITKALEDYNGSLITGKQEVSEAAAHERQLRAGQKNDIDSLAGSLNNFGEATSRSIRTLSEATDDVGSSLQRGSSQMEEFTDTVLDGMQGIRNSTRDFGSTAIAPMKNGGRVGYADGGVLQGGSGSRDDLYLGTVNGRAQLAMGGEYIINKNATKKHLSLLNSINADRYATGGRTPAQQEFMADVEKQIKEFGMTELQKSIQATIDDMTAMILEAKKLRLGEQDILRIKELQRLKEREILNERKKAQTEFMQTVNDSIADFSMTDVQKAIRDTFRELEDAVKQARELGLGEREIMKLRQLQQLQQRQILAEQKKAQDSFILGIKDQIAAFSMTDVQVSILETVRAMQGAIASARELGLGETEIMRIRKLQQLQQQEILAQQRKAQSDYMQDIKDQIAGFGMTEMQSSLLANRRAMEDAIAQAKDLGLGETDLAKVRRLYSLKAAEIMTAGLKDAVTEMTSFKDAMQGMGDETIKSAMAQQQLFDILSQAKSGDFTAVEKIGEVLNNISIDKSKYATAVDYARDYWKTMGAVNELQRLTSGRIDQITNPPTVTPQPTPAPVLSNAQVPVISSIAAAVTTASDANTAELIAVVKALQESVISGNIQTSKNTSKTSRLLERWEAIGMPDVRAA